MPKYLGEEKLESAVGTPFEEYDAEAWALHYATAYGGIDGEHHKTWVLDQMLRILLRTPVVVYALARWDDGQEEYRYRTGEPSEAYLAWVAERVADDYAHDVGIAP